MGDADTTSRPTGFLLKHLSRRTSGRKVIPEIDGLRSVAIVSVVLFHAAWVFDQGTGRVLELGLGENPSALGRAIYAVLHTGEYGVPVFFVISGFILALPFADAMTGGKPVSLVRYLTRRVTRLEPPYFVALLAAFILLVIQTGSFETWRNLLASAFYVHNVTYGEKSAVLPLAWSLEVEVQFYAIMPALAFVYTIGSAWVRRGLMACGMIIISIYFGKETPIWGRTVLHQGGYFLAGMLLADLYRHGAFGMGRPLDPGLWRARTVAWDALAFVCLAGTFVVKGLGWSPAQTAPWLILAGFIAVFRGGLIRRLFCWTPVVVLGGMCYTIYLWHFFVMRAAWPAWVEIAGPEPTAGHLILFVVVASISTIALSTVLFALIERPTMDPAWPRKAGAALARVFGRAREPVAGRSRRPSGSGSAAG